MKLFRISKNKVDIITEHNYRDKDVKGFGEKTLQEFIVNHPEIIPGEEIDPDDPLRFVVVKNEAGVTAGSMDILLVDQIGVPTIIEAKLTDNREIRRSIVGQGMDYIAHLKAEWSADKFINEGELFWQGSESSFETEIMAKLDLTIDGLIEKIASNIQKNKIRLIFASDKIPKELRLIIEFLNEAAMFDVFGLEVGFFANKNEEFHILAPRLIKSVSKSIRAERTKWNHDSFFEGLQQNATEAEIEVVKLLIEFGEKETGRNVEWGTGKDRGSFTARLVLDKHRFSLFSIYTTGEFTVNFGWGYDKINNLKSGLSENYRKMVNEKFNESFQQNIWEKSYPFIKLSKLNGDNILTFKQLITEFTEEITELCG